MDIRKKTKLFKSVSLLVLVVSSWCLLEFVSYLMLTPEEKSVPIQEFLNINRNQYIEDLWKQTGCYFSKTIVLHPMLGYVHRRPEYMPADCSMVSNNIGIDSPADLPVKKNDSDFVILIVGGSVAHLFSNYKMNHHGDNYLSQLLNEKYLPPNKKKFKVYTGAVGGWKMPNQVTMLTMYSDRIDAIIAIDGYNESFLNLTGGLKLEHIPADMMILAASSASGFTFFYMDTIMWGYRNIVLNSFLKYSYLANSLYKILLGVFREFVIPSQLYMELGEGHKQQSGSSQQENVQMAFASLESYVRKMALYGKSINIKTAHFLQPTRLYGKDLTEDEKIFKEAVPKEIYLQVNEMYKKLNRENYPVFDLTQIFANEKQTIYRDQIHFAQSNGQSRGNDLMGIAIVDHLAKAWNLKPIQSK